MSVYEFDFGDMNPQKWVNQDRDPKDAEGLLELNPNMPKFPIVGVDNVPRDDIFFERLNIDISQEVHEILPSGFRTMDRGVKNFFSNWPIPTTNGLKMMQVRIAGGDKPYLTWAQDLKRGRITLPVMAIKRENSTFHAEKFSPEGHYTSMRYLGVDRSRIAGAFRPVPALITYTCSTWAEHKKDLEIINYQFLRKFNPAAEFVIEDEHLRGSVFMKCDDSSCLVDDEVPPDQRQNKRMDYRITIEGWLPLPEKFVPTILGQVVCLKEGESKYAGGTVLDTWRGKKEIPMVRSGAWQTDQEQ